MISFSSKGLKNTITQNSPNTPSHRLSNPPSRVKTQILLFNFCVQKLSINLKHSLSTLCFPTSILQLCQSSCANILFIFIFPLPNTGPETLQIWHINVAFLLIGKEEKLKSNLIKQKVESGLQKISGTSSATSKMQSKPCLHLPSSFCMLVSSHGRALFCR